METSSRDYDENCQSPTMPLQSPVSQLSSTIIRVYLLGPLSLFGVVANLINIIVFSRMNKRLTVNISLLALAVSDCLGLLGTLWTSICLHPLVLKSNNLPFIPEEIEFVTGTWIHLVFINITKSLTFIICAERCLCILLPMKVKILITVRRIKVIICFLFLWGVASQYIMLHTTRVVWKFSEERNATLLGTKLMENWGKIQLPFLVVKNIVSHYIISFGIAIMTVINVVKLRLQSKWRQSVSQTRTSATITRRDSRVASTVIAICVIFLLCFLPGSVMFTATLTVPGLNRVGRHREMFEGFVSVLILLQNVNSSVNIFVYFIINAQYRQEFAQLCGRCRKRNPP
ncbi:neuropeptide receptor 15-like [Aplysia californica]|uniref:Neuropeptide receptor 15-like n=1 Tax=Aplysia californica TaxID=6500 RepID=A0ABM0JUP1_APLCA|nr:neuropeptide receptor 15-like [Aplysia californica]